MKDKIEKIDKIFSKSLQLPGSFVWYGIILNFVAHSVYKNFLKNYICLVCMFKIELILTLILLLFLLFYNYYFFLGKKNKKNIIINLYSDDKEIDKRVFSIQEEIEAILEENNQSDINVIVPNHCRRKNFSKSFLKKCKYKTYLTKSKIYKIFNKLWRSQIIIFGRLEERKNTNQLIVVNNKILIDIDLFNDKYIKDLNLIDNVNSQNDHFYVMNKENEYAEFRNISFSFSCIAKYYIGIGYFFSKNIIDAYNSHRFIIDNNGKREKYGMLERLFYAESIYIIRDLIDKRRYSEASKYVDYLCTHNIEIENTKITRMSLMMYSTNNISEFKTKVIDCFILLRGMQIEEGSHGILTVAYLELCRGNFSKALKKYYAHFNAVKNVEQQDYADVIKYCNNARNKAYEKEIAEFCLTCIYLGLGDDVRFQMNYNRLNSIRQSDIINSDLYKSKKNNKINNEK